ncbi:MAG: acetate/propionate family kinase [Gammaproteobacteria bacterium]
MTNHTPNEIMVVNAGSSSLRLTLFQHQDNRLQRVAAQRFEADPEHADTQLRQFMETHGIASDVPIAHRVVHGGARFKHAVRIDTGVTQHIADLIPLAPLHNPAALALIRTLETHAPDTPQVAVFDTAFFHNLPEVAKTYAIAAEVSQKHAIYRYGFHGLAHEYMWQQWCQLTGNTSGRGRVITLQLGSGCSMAAIKDGRAMDTSMGFSPLEGLVMATRSGDIDPGIALYLQTVAGYSVGEMDTLLNQHSGLLGVSQQSADMRALLEATDAQAKLALDIYCYRLRKYIGAYLSVLGGVDGIVFGGGVGENSAVIRARVLQDMTWCGIKLDNVKNSATLGHDGCISQADSQVEVWTIKVQEDSLIAQQTCVLLEQEHAPT